MPQRYKSKAYSERLAKANPYTVREMRNGCISTEAYKEAVRADHSLVRIVPEEILAEAFLEYTQKH